MADLELEKLSMDPAAQELIKKRMDSFKLNDRNGFDDYDAFRKKVVEAIDKLNTALP